MIGRKQGLVLLAMAAALEGASCGAGVAGVVASSGSSSGGGTAPTVLTLFQALDVAGNPTDNPKVSPATLRLGVSGVAPVEAAFFYQRLGRSRQPMSLVGHDENTVVLADPGTELSWDFAAEPLLEGTHFVDDVTLIVEFPDGTIPDGGTLQLGCGNDAPVVQAVEPIPTDPQNPAESSGNVEIRLRISDTSSDSVDITVDWRRQSDPPDSWTRATAAGVFPPGVETIPEGVQLSFFWNTNLDLTDEEDTVLFRVTADDRTEAGTPFETQVPFRVDNNAAPIAQIFNDLVVTNLDERRGIPIPFRVIDEEGDLVELIFQWRKRNEAFPLLPQDDGELAALLDDPLQRAAMHICTPYPRFAHGRVLPVDENSVRLPELAARESWILASQLEGRTLELLRPSIFPERITPPWIPNPLVSPRAALPIGDGLTALVLDFPGSGRLQEIELATGAVRAIAQLAGTPTAMTLEHGGEKTAIVASDLGDAWRLDRIELASGAVSPLFQSDGSHEPPPVRGLASFGERVLLFTAGSSLLHLDYRDLAAPRLGVIHDDFRTPFGVVRDPLKEGQLYLAERDFVTSAGTGRILSIDLDSHARDPVVVKMEPLQDLDQPEALALARRGARLLAVTSDPDGGRQLVGLDLGGREGNDPFAFGETIPGIQGEVTAVTSGPDGLLLLALSGTDELLVGGGLEQRRVIRAFEPRRQLALLETPLDPPSRPGQPWRWRIRDGTDGTRRKATPEGVDTTFVWDSADARQDGDGVFLRILPRDDESGTAAVGTAPKRVRASIDVVPLELGGPGTTNGPSSVAAADLDGNGDLDLVSANSAGNNLTVFLRTPSGFSSTPQGLPTPSGPAFVAAADLDGNGTQDLVSANRNGNSLTIFFQDEDGGGFDPSPPLNLVANSNPASVAAADLDGDGRLDLVSANQTSKNLTVFFQQNPPFPPGTFTDPQLLGGPSITNGPVSVATADLDGDGDLDLVSANESGNNLRFFQGEDGVFSANPRRLGNSGTTNGPVSVAAADLDGDGDQDLVSANRIGNNLTVFFQGAQPGDFPARPNLELGDPLTTNVPVSVAADDLDGDGDQDLVSANRFSASNLTVFFQQSSGSFATSPLELGVVSIPNQPVSVAAADLDGDGDQDLVSANQIGNNLRVFFQDSPGSPLELGVTLTPVGLGSVSAVAATDLDGDGDQDLVSAQIVNGRALRIFFQELPGIFAGSDDLSKTLSAVSISAADLDGDGDQDLVSANNVDNKLTVLLQVDGSTGGFVASNLGGPGITDGPSSVAAADLDGDGDQDLVSANRNGNSLTIFFQVPPPGTFAPDPLVLRPTAQGNSNPVSVVTADLDGDGDLDLVSANKASKNLTVFYQQNPPFPPGTFSDPQELGGPSITNGPVSLAAADLDGDGDLDLVSANETGNDLRFFQWENGVFTANPRRFGGNGPASVTAADFDGDGDLDLVSANKLGNNLTVFFQESPGSFATSPLVLEGQNGPISVVAGDLDGDGDQDLVAANENNGLLRIFWGGR